MPPYLWLWEQEVKELRVVVCEKKVIEELLVYFIPWDKYLSMVSPS